MKPTSSSIGDDFGCGFGKVLAHCGELLGVGEFLIVEDDVEGDSVLVGYVLGFVEDIDRTVDELVAELVKVEIWHDLGPCRLLEGL